MHPAEHSDTQKAAVDDGRRSRRSRASAALDALGILDRLVWARARLGIPALTVVTYHRVATMRDVGELDAEVADVGPDDFANQLALIASHFRGVSADDVRRFSRGASLPPNAVLIAFDDGYLDNHRVALPLLAQRGLPATFFIPTAFPDAGRLFWWDRIALLVRRCRRSRVTIRYPRHAVVFPRQSPDVAIDRIQRMLKQVAGSDLARVWDELERALDVSLSADEERAIAGRTIMGWSEIRALRCAGMDVQSHSHRHRVLDTLSPDEALRDLVMSRRILESVLGEPIHSVAYPVGYPVRGAYRSAVAEAGFDVGFTNSTGLCFTGCADPLNLPRLSMGTDRVGANYKLHLLVGQRSHRRDV